MSVWLIIFVRMEVFVLILLVFINVSVFFSGWGIIVRLMLMSVLIVFVYMG